MGSTKLSLFCALIAIGSAWGLTVPLAKIAVSTGHEELGLIFWEVVFMLIYLGVISAVTRNIPKITKDHMIIFIAIAFLGTLLPTTLTYIVLGQIPAGVYSITISLVPMFAVPVAIFLNLETFSVKRVVGIVLGLCAIIVLIGPSTALPDPAKIGFVLLACLAAFFYSLENNFVGKFTLRGLTPVQALFGSSVVALILISPLAFGSGQWFSLYRPWGPPEWALLAMSILHGFAYTGYVWLVGRAGPVFTAQVAYIVTLSAVLWSMLVLGESYTTSFWIALSLMVAGLFLVLPKEQPQT